MDLAGVVMAAILLTGTPTWDQEATIEIELGGQESIGTLPTAKQTNKKKRKCVLIEVSSLDGSSVFCFFFFVFLFFCFSGVNISATTLTWTQNGGIVIVASGDDQCGTTKMLPWLVGEWVCGCVLHIKFLFHHLM